MTSRHIRSARSLGLLLLSVIAWIVPSVPADAAPRRGVRVRVVRPARVNAHRRAGYWRGWRRGTRVRVLPVGYAAVVVGGRRFFHYGGVYYEPAGSEYVVVAPPVGAVIAAVPEGCVPAAFGGIAYNYCAGTYYAPAPGGFAVVAAPIGITVDELPVGCEEVVTVNGVDHYSCDGLYYKPLEREGATLYVTVKP